MQRSSFAKAFPLVAALTLAFFPQTGLARGFRVLHTFQGGFSNTDGAFPMPGLTIGADGNLYGVTQGGGNSGGCLLSGCGTVFKIAPGGDYSVLHRFTNMPDGAQPNGGIVADKSGNLYGTTSEGGTDCQNDFIGCGTIFKLSSENAETVLYAFPSAGGPTAGLVRDKKGNLFGVLSGGGATNLCGGRGCGMVFRLSPAGELKILYEFKGGTDGIGPEGSLIRDDAGNLYGVTSGGGRGNCENGCGTVFKVDVHGNETVIYAFKGRNDGRAPMGPLIRDKAGNLYGTTRSGAVPHYGCGTVFKVTPDGVETILHNFTSGNERTREIEPFSSLAMDAAGNLYGTALVGGGSSCGGGGCGTIFRIAPDGTETVLHSFNGSDGGGPLGLIIDRHGNLFGVTSGGGAGLGVVFEQETGTGE